MNIYVKIWIFVFILVNIGILISTYINDVVGSYLRRFSNGVALLLIVLISQKLLTDVF